MTRKKPLSLYFALVLTATLIATPSFASKRRSVMHPSPGVETKIEGVVLDAVTGAPVNAVEIKIGSDSSYTDHHGRFVRVVTGSGQIEVVADRSGYHSETVRVAAGGSHNLTVRLNPKPTVTVRTTEGTTIQIDAETVQFGYPIPFSGYRSAEFEDFCLPNGTSVQIDRSEMKRIFGPAAAVNYPTCCSTGPVLKMNIELRNGQRTDVYFSDSCDGFDRIDLIGRDHVTGTFVYIRLTTVTEVTFP